MTSLLGGFASSVSAAKELFVVFNREHLFEQFFAFFGLGLEELRELAYGRVRL